MILNLKRDTIRPWLERVRQGKEKDEWYIPVSAAVVEAFFAGHFVKEDGTRVRMSEVSVETKDHTVTPTFIVES